MTSAGLIGSKVITDYEKEIADELYPRVPTSRTPRQVHDEELRDYSSQRRSVELTRRGNHQVKVESAVKSEIKQVRLV